MEGAKGANEIKKERIVLRERRTRRYCRRLNVRNWLGARNAPLLFGGKYGAKNQSSPLNYFGCQRGALADCRPTVRVYPANIPARFLPMGRSPKSRVFGRIAR